MPWRIAPHPEMHSLIFHPLQWPPSLFRSESRAWFSEQMILHSHQRNSQRDCKLLLHFQVYGHTGRPLQVRRDTLPCPSPRSTSFHKSERLCQTGPTHCRSKQRGDRNIYFSFRAWVHFRYSARHASIHPACHCATGRRQSYSEPWHYQHLPPASAENTVTLLHSLQG